MKRNIRDWVRSCTQCQKAKVQGHNKSPLGTFTTPDARFSHIHLDIVELLPQSRGHSYLLTCVDRFARWPEAIPLTDTTTETVLRAFLLNWVAKFRAPKIVTTDRGVQFEDSRLKNCTHVFLRCDRGRKPSQPPYDGPFKVLNRSEKTFTILLNEH